MIANSPEETGFNREFKITTTATATATLLNKRFNEQNNGCAVHEESVKNTSRRRVFSTFLECSQITDVFYHGVIHGLGFFVCFKLKYRFHTCKTIKLAFSVLYSDKTWVFDQSARAGSYLYFNLM